MYRSSAAFWNLISKKAKFRNRSVGTDQNKNDRFKGFYDFKDIFCDADHGSSLSTNRLITDDPMEVQHIPTMDSFRSPQHRRFGLSYRQKFEV